MSSNNINQLENEMSEDIAEWIESLAYVYEDFGIDGVKLLLRKLQEHALLNGVSLSEATLNTPYINTIPLAKQPAYPGDLEVEKKIENINRWNAMAMVMQAYDEGEGVGGHIATYASAATILETGFNHFFKNKTENYGGDMVLPQPHAAPGIYARAFLEGRISEERLKNFRRELKGSGGLCSYPHPRSMPDFWQMPNASMGLSTVSAIYQARFTKYLENRGLKEKNGGKIWCFIGDGESDEPEVLGSINIAARENLDNLVLVVNCNLQRLDGPVRGNGKIIQELERSFRGAGWDVIKVIWGSGWDLLLERDEKGILIHRMESCLDGDYQRYSVLPGDAQREHWIDGNPELEQMMAMLTDQELAEIKRGGQDAKKIFAAYKKATQTQGKPSVILTKTVKGEGMGDSGQGKNTVHQKKNLSTEERIQAVREFGIPISDEEAAGAAFYKPEDDSIEMQYLHKRRTDLGGYLPIRVVECPSLSAPDLALFSDVMAGSGKRQVSTTMVMVRIIAKLLKDKSLGKYIVPIVPDEARTFGMDALFSSVGIYSAHDQKYTPVDAGSLMTYKEATNGQILQEGICEAGAIASFMAAGTAFAVHGIPTIPFYVFYSMFGFQRVGDMVWASADMMTRGFLLGGTAGRSTLNGEGLQHQDGHSHILASTFPNLLSYDPAFGYELAIIVREGIRRMYQEQENIFYYITLYNENYPMPAIYNDNEGVTEGVIKGGYCWQRSRLEDKAVANVHILSSGSIITQAISAAVKLESMNIACHIWSITSFSELAREAQEFERHNTLNPFNEPKKPFVTELFGEETGVAVAVTDYMKSYSESISRWMPIPYSCLGTDGFGISESRVDLRQHFEISDDYIVITALSQLYRNSYINKELLQSYIAQSEHESTKQSPIYFR